MLNARIKLIVRRSLLNDLNQWLRVVVATANILLLNALAQKFVLIERDVPCEGLMAPLAFGFALGGDGISPGHSRIWSLPEPFGRLCPEVPLLLTLLYDQIT